MQKGHYGHYSGNARHSRKEEMIHDHELIYDAKKELHNAAQDYKHDSPARVNGSPLYEVSPTIKPSSPPDTFNDKKMADYRESLEVKYPISEYVGENKKYKHSNQWKQMIDQKQEGFLNMANTSVENNN
jgi:hypothetical protein|tara:strand:- start:630 stop:1016 length:387 start_codon:yes stop_codon:yes gene_type:complete